MTARLRKYKIDSPDKVIRHVRCGCHAFIGCDDLATGEQFVQALGVALPESPIECVRGGKVANTRDFAVQIVESCQRLVKGIGGRFHPSMSGIAPSLESAMLAFGAAERQGYLILSDIDPPIRMQRTIELEGPLRSVMQLHDDVALVFIGSNDVINKMVGDYERPFYMSFRVFRL